MGEQFYLGPYELGPNETPENGIYTGDARELAQAIPDESVDLIFTDPVYQNIDDNRWLAETAVGVLKPDSACLAYYGIGFLPEVLQALSSHLRYEWQYINYMPTLNARGAYKTFSNYRGLVCYHKGRAVPLAAMRDLLVDGFSARNNGHGWAKNLEVIAYYITKYVADGITVDFFTGGGTVPAVCKMLGRRYLAFEIDPATAELARERVRMTQPPLPGLTLETQAALKLMEDGNG